MQPYKFKIIVGDLAVKKFVNHLRMDGNEFIFNGFSKDENEEIFLELLIPYGKTEFEYNSHRFMIEAVEYNDIHGLDYKTAKHEELFITIFCDSKDNACILFKNFIKDMEMFSKNKKEDTIRVLVYDVSNGWAKLSRLPKRNIDTIYISKDMKSNLIQDIKFFYNCKDEYHKYGIPYTRRYLFVGPPGTGKTSLIFALASMFNKEVSIISFDQKLDDASLMKAINSLDNNNFLVMEDVDALFDNRNERSATNNSNVSFSGMLNILDGFGRKDGLIVFMTTNHINKLDEAQIRPGRVDYIITFGNPKEEQIREMFENFFPNQKEKFKKIYDSISRKKVSMAILQKFFFDNRHCNDILEKIPDFNKIINTYLKEEKILYN